MNTPTTPAAQLSDQAVQRLRAARRLAAAKLDNVEEQLQRCHRQADRLRLFVTLRTELDAAQSRLFALGKQQAAMLTQQQELARFEEFEPMSPLFQQLTLLTAHIDQLNSDRADNSRTLALRQQELTAADQRLSDSRSEQHNALDTLTAAAYTMSDAERLTAMAEACRTAITLVQPACNSLHERSQRLANLLQETDTLIATHTQHLNDVRATLQGLEPHRHMLETSHALLVQLDELARAMDWRDSLSMQLEQAIRQQNEHNERLGMLFRSHEEIKAAIATKDAEVHNHRQEIAGRDTYAMQLRALDLRSRGLMFETALALWQGIAEGFDLTEHEEAVVTQLRQQADMLHKSTAALETEIHQLQQQLQQRTHHWTMAKSQNVVCLRSDLSEGTACTVCGSTHHPWHSESMREQSALITSLKADVDNISTTLDNRRHTLQQQQCQLAAIEAKTDVANETIRRLNDRLQRDIAEWAHFSTLDSSLRDCSRSTNRPARTAILRQLIEKTRHDADEAGRDLKALTYHLDTIDSLSEDIRQLQRQATDLSNTMGEENTACQVMARQTVRLNRDLKAATQDYAQRYDALTHAITLPEWFQQWKASHESVKMRIQELATQWAQANSEAASISKELATLQARQEQMRQSQELTMQHITQIEAMQARMDDIASKADDSIKRMPFHESDARTHFTNAVAAHADRQRDSEAAQQQQQQQQEQYLTAQIRARQLQQHASTAEQSVAAIQQQIDIAIRRYNASHPPVQAAELTRVFAGGNDWNTVRQTVRQLTIDKAVAEARVDTLRARIVTLQAEGLRIMDDNWQREQDSLITQQAELQDQRSQILMQIAAIDVQLANAAAS